MLFARCISKLAKRLFPDVISGSYVEGEIEDVKVKDEKTIDSKVIPISAPPEIEMKVEELKAEEETPKDKNPIQQNCNNPTIFSISRRKLLKLLEFHIPLQMKQFLSV